jgi:hypothetical protein
MSYPQQAFPLTLLSTQERAGTNASDTPQVQSSGSQSILTLAWQFLAALASRGG